MSIRFAIKVNDKISYYFQHVVISGSGSEQYKDFYIIV